MEKLACLGLLDPGCKTENVYVQLLETINKKEFTARSITVTIVDALSDIVYVAKSKTDPPTLPMLSLSGLNQLTRNVYLSICVFVYLYLRF